jgi:hypothetical protein
VRRKLNALTVLVALAFALWGQRDLVDEHVRRAHAWWTTEEPLTPPARVLVDRLADAGVWEASGHCDGRVVTLTSRGGGPGAVSVDVPDVPGGLKVLQGKDDVTPLLTAADRKRVRTAAGAACEAVLARERTRLAARLASELARERVHEGGEALAKGTR